jgi:hypothetical protein
MIKNNNNVWLINKVSYYGGYQFDSFLKIEYLIPNLINLNVYNFLPKLLSVGEIEGNHET